MVTKVGSGDFTYEVVMPWGKLPEGWSFRDVPGVAVDSKDRVYVFNRGEHPMIIFDREGNFLSSWGEGLFSKRPHGVTIGPDDTVYCADDGSHVVRKCTPDGKVLMTIGMPGQPAPRMSGHPFNRPTGVALDRRTGDIYVSDGYGNARVHKYSPDGKYLFSWGEPGTDPGQFQCVHSVSTDAEGLVYICDRENFRIQIFDSKGKYLTQWNNMIRPGGLAIDVRHQICYLGEIGPDPKVDKSFPNCTPRVTILDLKGKRIGRLGDVLRGPGPHQFVGPHGIAVDSRGDLYIGQDVATAHMNDIRDTPPEMHCLRKLIRQK